MSGAPRNFEKAALDALARYSRTGKPDALIQAGDYFARAGFRDRAIQVYIDAAEAYDRVGEWLKAIACVRMAQTSTEPPDTKVGADIWQRVVTFFGAESPRPSPERCIRCGRHEVELKVIGLAASCGDCIAALKEVRAGLIGSRPAWVRRGAPPMTICSCQRLLDDVEGFYTDRYGRVCSACIDALVAAWGA